MAMAWDSSDNDYHLTPRGLLPGPPPEDRVETWNRSMYQASGWSREQVTWTCKWVNEEIPRADRDALREKYRDQMVGRSSDMVATMGEPL